MATVRKSGTRSCEDGDSAREQDAPRRWWAAPGPHGRTHRPRPRAAAAMAPARPPHSAPRRRSARRPLAPPPPPPPRATQLLPLPPGHRRRPPPPPARMLSGILMTLSAIAATAVSAEETFNCPKMNSTHLCNCTSRNVTCDGLGVTDLRYLQPFAALIHSLSAARNDLRELPLELLHNATQLTTLDLSHNKINSVKMDLLTSVSSLEYLSLSDNELRDFYLPGNVLPRLKILVLSANALLSLKIDARPNNAFIELWLDRNELHDLSSAFAYNRLIRLYLADNAIGNNLDFVRRLPELQLLSLGSNNISFIPSNMFSSNKLLRFLFLDNNKLNDLEILYYSTDLFRLNVSCNNITHIPERIFRDLILLNTLHLANNGITNASFVKHLANGIIELNLSHNKISTLDPKHFENKTKLEYIDVSNNELTDITFSTKLGKLETLLADNNEISEIGGSTFFVNSNNAHRRPLKNLSLNNNFLTDITFLLYLSNIVNLNLQGNQLSTISENILRNLPHLETLNLSDNRIGDASFVSKIKSLRSIDLSKNAVRMFPCNSHLEYVYLDGNNVTELDLTCAPRLRHIAVCGSIIRDKNGGLLSVSRQVILNLNNKTVLFEGLPSFSEIQKSTEMCYVEKESKKLIFSHPIAFAIYSVCAALFLFIVVRSTILLYKWLARRNSKMKKCTCGKDQTVKVNRTSDDKRTALLHI